MTTYYRQYIESYILDLDAMVEAKKRREVLSPADMGALRTLERRKVELREKLNDEERRSATA